MARRLVLGGAAAVLVVAGLLPLLSMALQSVTVAGHLSLASYHGALHTARSGTLLAHSLAVAAWTSGLTTVVGVPLGLLLGRTDLPGRRLFALLFTVPLALPPFILAVCWAHLIGPRGPMAAIASQQTLAAARSLLFGLPGCVLVLSTTFLPVVMLLTLASLVGVSPRLEEAARLHARWPAVWRGITVPLIRPGLGFAALLVFLLSLGELSVPMYLRYDVFPVESFTQFSASYDFGAATAAAVPLAAVALLVLLGEGRLRQLWAAPLQPSSSAEGVRAELGWDRYPLLALPAMLAAGLVVAPILGLVVESASVPTWLDALSRAGDSLGRGVLFAALGATALTVVGFLVGYAVHARALAGWRAVDALSLVLFATPGTVLGIGLISLWNRPGLPVYGTPAVLLLAYIAQYTALTSRITQAVLASTPRSMEEAARVVGAGWPRRMLGIILPLTRPGLAAAWLVAYLFCLRDVGATMLVFPPGLDPLSIRTLTLMANGSPERVAALCVLMIATALLPLGLLALLRPGRSRAAGRTPRQPRPQRRPSAMAALAFRNVSKSYGPRRVISQLDLELDAGQRLAIVGPSGCGKTTALRLLAGLAAPDEGTVEIGGCVVAARGRIVVEPEARDVGMVFQDLALWPHLTVRGNLEFGLAARGVPPSERKRRVQDVLRRLHMDEHLDRRPGQLSGGQQQRVAIGRALVLRPKILLMDEPLSSLDEALSLELRAEIVRLHEALGFTLVHVTHNMEEAYQLAQVIAVMQEGQVVRCGPVSRQAEANSSR